MSSSRNKKARGPRGGNDWSDWGPWVWSKSQKLYYCQRQDLSGNIETHWAPPRHTEQSGGAASQTAPRRDDDDQDQLADQFGQMGLRQDDDAEDAEDDEDADYEGYSQRPAGQSSSGSKGKSKSSSSGKRESKSKPSGSGSSKRKQKAVYQGKMAIVDEDDNEGGGSSPPEDYGGGAYYGGQPSRGGYQSYDQGGQYSGYRDGEEQENDRQYEDTLADTLAASLQDQQKSSRRGESSSHQDSSSRYSRRREKSEYAGDHGGSSADYGGPSADYGGPSADYGGPSADYGGDYGGSSADYGGPSADYDGREYDQASEGNLTPRGPGRFDISGNNEEYEALDPRYRVEPSHKFQPGEVFKVLWPEPTGQSVGGTGTISDKQKVKGKHGESFYVGFRRFVVVANDYGHCQCVPILTYGGKGCNKRGVKPEKHGIVYDGRSRARPLPGEPTLGFASVRLAIEVEGESLAKASRINYSKIVTVEHNVKVFFIGHITSEDYQLVADAVNQCWEDKIFQRKKHHRDYDRR